MYANMVTLQAMDATLYEAQRQGRISFYLTTTGEEAANIGSAAALTSDDVVLAQVRNLIWRTMSFSSFAVKPMNNYHLSYIMYIVNLFLFYGGQYREPGVLLWRGFTLQEFANQCFGNKGDYGKGRQMPIHYGSNKHNYITVSSPLA